MDKFDLDNVDCNKLYKTHTGHLVFDESDDDSIESEAETNKLYDANEPPLYTYEELQANLGNFEPENDTIQKTNIEYYEVVNKGTSISKEMNRKLKKLLLPDYCLICDADLVNPRNAQSHYNSNRHKDNLKYWKDREKNTSKLLMENMVTKSSKKPAHNVTKNTTETIKMHCKICNVTDYSVNHYNSTLHQRNVEAFCFVCNIKTMSKEQLAEHIKGAKHMAKKENIDKPKIAATTSVDKKDTSKLPEEINRKLEKIILSDYCHVCHANLALPGNAQSHYKSNRHKDQLKHWKDCELHKLKLATKNVVVIKPSNKLVQKVTEHTTKTFKVNCHICNITDCSEDHYNSTLHQRNVEAYCFVCNLKTMSKEQLAEHVKGAKHVKNLNQIENINKVESAAATCVDKKKPPVDISSGTNCELNVVPLKGCYCETCHLPLNGTKLNEDHYTLTSHIEKTMKRFFCHLCDVECFTRDELLNHKSSFPHCRLIIMKSDLVLRGISSEYWRETTNLGFICLLCNRYLYTDSNAASHFTSTKHCDSYNSWTKYEAIYLQDVNRRWYYCDICKITLDGTSDVELHYQGKYHIQNKVKFDTKDAVSVSFPSTECSGASNSSITGYSDNEVDQSSPSETDREEYVLLKSEMLNQIEEFIDHIYFSNRIPLRIALKYIQKYNREIVNLKTTSNYIINKEECALNLNDNVNQESFEDSDDDWDGFNGKTYEADSNGYTPTIYFNDYRYLSKNINSCLLPYSERPETPRGYSFSKILFGGAVGLFFIYLLKYR